MDPDKKLDDQIRTELDDRQRELFEELQRQQEKDEHLRAIGLTRTSASIEIPTSTTAPLTPTQTLTTATATAAMSSTPTTTTIVTPVVVTSSTATTSNIGVDSEYERRASKELERQRQVSAEIARKKEVAAKRDSAEREAKKKNLEQRKEEFEKLPPQTLSVRRVSDGFEIQYKTASLLAFKERVPCYLDSDWPQRSPTMLQELLPSPFCIRLIYGKGLKKQGIMDTIHVDPLCPRSHITYQMLEGAKRRKLTRPVALTLSWGRCRKFSCDTYVDTEFFDPPTSKMTFPIRLCVVDDPGYYKNRITLGYDFLSQYVHSKKGPFEAGDILLGDRQGYWWATTYQRKVRYN